MAGTPVTEEDLKSVRDVPIEEAFAYLEGLERRLRAARGGGEPRRQIGGPIDACHADAPAATRRISGKPMPPRRRPRSRPGSARRPPSP